MHSEEFLNKLGIILRALVRTIPGLYLVLLYQDYSNQYISILGGPKMYSDSTY